MTPSEILVTELISLGCPPARAFTLVNDAMRQWQQPERSRHAIAQAKYYAAKKKRTEKLSHTDQHMISADQHGDGKEGPPHTPPKETITSTVPSTTDALASADTTKSDRKALWDQGIKIYMTLTGASSNTARALIGRWAKLVDGDALQVLSAIEQAQIEQPANPRAWIFGTLNKIAKENAQSSTPAVPKFKHHQVQSRENTRAISAAIRSQLDTLFQDRPPNGTALVGFDAGTIPALSGHDEGEDAGDGGNLFDLPGNHAPADSPPRNGHGH